MPITLVFLPAADIAAYVGEGNVDMGITGQDIIAETRAEVTVHQVTSNTLETLLSVAYESQICEICSLLVSGSAGLHCSVLWYRTLRRRSSSLAAE
jgi:hypothetical protein